MTATTAGSGPTHPGPTRPTTPPPPPRDLVEELLGEIADQMVCALSRATLLPDTTDRIATCGQEILKHRLRMARMAVAELRLYAQSPARQSLSSAAAVPGGPVSSPRPEGKVRAGGPLPPGAGFGLPTPQPWPGRPFPVHKVSS